MILFQHNYGKQPLWFCVTLQTAFQAAPVTYSLPDNGIATSGCRRRYRLGSHVNVISHRSTTVVVLAIKHLLSIWTKALYLSGTWRFGLNESGFEQHKSTSRAHTHTHVSHLPVCLIAYEPVLRYTGRTIGDRFKRASASATESIRSDQTIGRCSGRGSLRDMWYYWQYTHHLTITLP